MNASSSNRHLWLLVALSSAVGISALGRAGWLWHGGQRAEMFLAPMIGVIEPCIFLQPEDAGKVDAELAGHCTGPHGSAGALVESTLAALAPPDGQRSAYELGYTLPVPLLKLFKPAGDAWAIDQDAVGRLVRTLHDVDRPAVVYLFSDHFAVGAPIEESLNADPRNLAVTPDGPLPRDSYYSTPIYNWTIASTRTPIFERRVQAAKAVLDGICGLEPRDIAKIRGVTLLGETHHLFPNFEGGMGFSPPYRVSDYSDASRRGFRQFLQKKYGFIEQLNQLLGTRWKSFDEVDPPSKDVRTTPLRDFTEHIDSFAQGSLPVAGWTHLKSQRGGPAPMVRIYRNGELVGKTPVRLSRQDVLQAQPQLGDENPGWRFDLDFRSVPPGMHRIDVLLETGSGPLLHLATRQVAIMDRTQTTPSAMPQKPLPPSVPAADLVLGHVDLPADQSSYFYNPLVPLWHEFRGQQVVDYLESFGSIVAQSCLAGTARYTHQIIPFTNPGWDENKYAVAPSLQPLKGIRLGVSLYGEPTYGTSFSDWLAGRGHARYGITEFHPLKAMTPASVQAMLEAHEQRGATFISFFLEPRWKGALVSRGHNPFSLDPDNHKLGSDQLYDSIRSTLRTAR